MITYDVSTTDEELLKILDLQKQNLPESLTNEDIKSQGFVTVRHTFAELKMLNSYEQHLIIKDENNIVGYLLAMTRYSKNDIPALVPMFDVFNEILCKNKQLSAYNYLVVGQVCIAKDYRGLGLLYESYHAYKQRFKGKYDLAITEIALSNQRSMHAHKRIGFSEIHQYTDMNNIEWSVVVWDW